MAKPADAQPTISDPAFRRAVALIDAGDTTALTALLDAEPRLLRHSADEDGSFAGAYFRTPRLLWFVAENPIRNGVLPANIATVAQVIVDAARKHRLPDLADVAEYTLGLVCSGQVPRESRVVEDLVDVLVDAGARPDGALRSALGHRERGAVQALLARGAALTLPVAAGLGRTEDLQRLFAGADDDTRFEALVVAAIAGESVAVRILLDRGVSPNRHAPEQLGAHATPLHHAIAADSMATVTALVTRGADVTLRDRTFGGDAMGWAEHFGHADIRALLVEAARIMPAVVAIRSGDVDTLVAWLAANPDRVGATLGTNPRTLLHYATDWPGGLPRVGESIRALIAAGADPDAPYVGDSEARETPVHWAASSGDVEALDALIDGGANIDATGSVLGGGTALGEAVVFRKFPAAARLLAAGAAFDLPIAAGVGRRDLVESFFDDAGRYHNPHPPMPDRGEAVDPKREIDQALIFAARGGHLEIARALVKRGADRDARSPVGTSAVDEARQFGGDDVLAYLESLRS